MADDPYAMLGLSQGATADEVRGAYFRLVRQYPPEAHPEEFKRVRAAYEALRSPVRLAELALLAFDETAAAIDFDLIESASGADIGVTEGDLDVASILLALELRASDLTRTDFTADLTPITSADLTLGDR